MGPAPVRAASSPSLPVVLHYSSYSFADDNAEHSPPPPPLSALLAALAPPPPPPLPASASPLLENPDGRPLLLLAPGRPLTVRRPRLARSAAPASATVPADSPVRLPAATTSINRSKRSCYGGGVSAALAAGLRALAPRRRLAPILGAAAARPLRRNPGAGPAVPPPAAPRRAARVAFRAVLWDAVNAPMHLHGNQSSGGAREAARAMAGSVRGGGGT